MKYIQREDTEKQVLPGRVIQKVVGKDGPLKSWKMTVGFAHYSMESGEMEPHQHAEETVYIVDASKGWVLYGNRKDCLANKVDLVPGMTLHLNELEWHVFQYGEGGFVDIIFTYGQVDNIRPEEIEALR